MAHYYFHLRCQDKDVLDQSGADLCDPDQAWEAAQATARALMEGEPDANVNWLTCHFEVVDHSGEIVFELPFLELVDLPKLN